MKVRTFALLGSSVLETVRHKLMATVEQWRSDWGLERLELDVECGRAWEAAPISSSVPWQHTCAAGDKEVWLAWQPELVRYVQRHVFPPDQRHAVSMKGGGSMAADGAEQAVRRLSAQIAAAAGVPETSGRSASVMTPDAAMTSDGSGAVTVRIWLGEQPIHCLLNHACVREIGRMQHGAPSLAGVVGDLSKVPVTLPIELGQAEVEIGSLLTLAVGDVIRLNTSVDKPLTVRGPGGKALFNAHLGIVGQQVAIEIAGRGE